MLAPRAHQKKVFLIRRFRTKPLNNQISLSFAFNKGSTNTTQPQHPMLTQYFLEKMRERKRKWAFFQLCHSPVSSLSLGLEFGKAFDLFIRICNFCIIFSSGSLLFVICIVNLAWFVKIQVGFCFMWSGFDLIGLGYVYLQPWFDFF